MWFTVCIEQNVPRFDVPMQNSVFMRVMNSPRQLRDEFRRRPDRHRLALQYLIKLSAFDKSHAEVASAVALAHFIDWYDARMIQAGGSFRFATEALEMRLGGPVS